MFIYIYDKQVLYIISLLYIINKILRHIFYLQSIYTYMYVYIHVYVSIYQEVKTDGVGGVTNTPTVT